MCDAKFIDAAAGVFTEAVKGISGPDWVELGIGVAGKVAEYSEGRKYASAVRGAADTNYAAEVNALNLQREQSEAQGRTEAHQRAIEAKKEAARARVYAGESGATLAGSNARVVGEAIATGGRNIAEIEANSARRSTQIESEKQGAAARRQTTRSTVREPSFAELGLSIAGLTVGKMKKP